MNSEKQRVISFMLLTFASIMAINLALRSAGLLPDEAEPVAQAPAAKAEADALAKAKLAANPPGAAKSEAEKAKTAGETPAAKDSAKPVVEAPQSKIELAKVEELRLGSTQAGKKLVDKDRSGYHLEVQLEQKGAAVHSVASAFYEAEYHETKPKGRPLEILQADPKAIPSLAMTIRPNASLAPKVTTGDEERDEAGALAEAVACKAEIPRRRAWEVVRDDQGRAVRAVSRVDATKGSEARGQEIRFRTTVDELGLTVIKSYRLFEGSDAFEVSLEFQGGEKTPAFGYRLMGPHGIPIEGEWYTGTFRDAVFSQIVGGRVEAPKTLSASTSPRPEGRPGVETAPIAYAGIEKPVLHRVHRPLPAAEDRGCRFEAEDMTARAAWTISKPGRRPTSVSRSSPGRLPSA
ncbi:MAG: hypothetical protein U0835_25185 [Isosphaeraceae bacterium]